MAAPQSGRTQIDFSIKNQNGTFSPNVSADSGLDLADYGMGAAIGDVKQRRDCPMCCSAALWPRRNLLLNRGNGPLSGDVTHGRPEFRRARLSVLRGVLVDFGPRRPGLIS